MTNTDGNSATAHGKFFKTCMITHVYSYSQVAFALLYRLQPCMHGIHIQKVD